MTEEHKQKISQSCMGKSKNKGKIYITNDLECKAIYPEQLQEYITKGYRKGRYYKEYQPWNKGLKATEDERVAKMRRIAKRK